MHLLVNFSRESVQNMVGGVTVQGEPVPRMLLYEDEGLTSERKR